MNKSVWVDDYGNTCIGIKPEEKPVIIEEKKGKKEEVKHNDIEKNVKSNRRKRP